MNHDDFWLDVRTAHYQGQTYFYLLDVVKALRTANPDRLVEALDEDEKITLDKITGDASDARTFLVSEPAVFKIALRQRSRAGRAFLRFVCHGVLPALRERGSYKLPVRDNREGGGLVRDLRAPIAAAEATAAKPVKPTGEDLPW